MKIYRFDETGVFDYEDDAIESPLEPGVFLVPAFATTVSPPPFDATVELVRWNGSVWMLESIPVPPPPPEPPSPAEVRNGEIRSRLSRIDTESVRPLRAVYANTATDYDRTKLAALDAEAELLRAELETLK